MKAIAKLPILIALVIFLGAPAQALERIRVAVSNPNMPNLTVAMAQKNGLFKDEALEAEIIRMNPNVAITALATGDVDYCQLFGAVVVGAIAGLPVRSSPAFSMADDVDRSASLKALKDPWAKPWHQQLRAT